MLCKAIFRGRLAQRTWEKSIQIKLWENLCSAVVGNPVHMDVVLAKPGSHSARFCFSAYVNQEFEMCLMDKEQVMDPLMINQSIDITVAEYERCMKYMLELVERRTKYDYMDALLLMPLAPKGVRSAPKFASMMRPLIPDVQPEHPVNKVFCSQSVVLMLRECLHPEGIHAAVVEKLGKLNSRLVSPKMVFDILQEHPFTEIITNTQLSKLGSAYAPTQSCK